MSNKKLCKTYSWKKRRKCEINCEISVVMSWVRIQAFGEFSCALM